MQSHFSLIWESVADAVPEHIALIQGKGGYPGASMKTARHALRKD